MQVGFRTVEGVRVRCAESTGLSLPSILLTSPWPESVYAFAPIWPPLANVARLVAVDLPGFGRSERRDDLHALAFSMSVYRTTNSSSRPGSSCGKSEPASRPTAAVMSLATEGGNHEFEQ